MVEWALILGPDTAPWWDWGGWDSPSIDWGEPPDLNHLHLKTNGGVSGPYA